MLRVDILGIALADINYVLVANVTNPEVGSRERIAAEFLAIIWAWKAHFGHDMYGEPLTC